MINMVEFNKKRIASGKAPEKQTPLHAAFMGNPGTGKATVARLLGQVLFGCGCFSQGKNSVSCKQRSPI